MKDPKDYLWGFFISRGHFILVVGKKEKVNAGNITFGAAYKPGMYFVEVINGKERKQISVLKLYSNHSNVKEVA